MDPGELVTLRHQLLGEVPARDAEFGFKGPDTVSDPQSEFIAKKRIFVGDEYLAD